MGSVSAWEGIFMLVVLKIPMVYLAGVVWWAIRAEPRTDGGGSSGEYTFVPLTPCGWDEWQRARSSRRRGRGPTGSRSRLPRRVHGPRIGAPV